MKNEMSLTKKLSTKTIAKIGVLSAISTVLMLFEFPLFFAPAFYKLDLSELPVLIGAFALGPIAGVAIELIKVLLNLILNGTITGGVGEFANFIVGCAFVVPASLIYRNKKSFKTAIVGMLVGTLAITVLGSILNYYMLLPFYAKFTPIDEIIAAGSNINNLIVDKFTFVLYAVAPFNFVKGLLVSLITLVLYKKVSPILHK